MDKPLEPVGPHRRPLLAASEYADATCGDHARQGTWGADLRRKNSTPVYSASMRTFAPPPRLHFGGVKEFRYEREVSDFGIRELCNIKTVLDAVIGPMVCWWSRV